MNNRSPQLGSQGLFTEVPSLKQINTAGTWVAKNSGQVFQIAPECLQFGHSPTFNVPGTGPLILLDLDYAALPSKVRMNGSERGISVQNYENPTQANSSATS